MKILSLLLITLLGFMQCQAQDTLTSKSLEEVIENSIKSFRVRIANDKAIIYYKVGVKLDKKNIDIDKNDFFVESNITAKILDYKTPKYLLDFIVSMDKGRIFASVIQWRLNKKSNKQIELIDLMTRDYYWIASPFDTTMSRRQ